MTQETSLKTRTEVLSAKASDHVSEKGVNCIAQTFASDSCGMGYFHLDCI